MDVQRIYECEDMEMEREDVALLYDKNVDNMSHELLMPFVQLPPEARNLEFVVNCLAKTGRGPISTIR